MPPRHADGLVSLAAYKGLQAPLTDWDFVITRCRQVGRTLLKRELTGALPSKLPLSFTLEPFP